MKKASKRLKKNLELVEADKIYSLDEAVSILKKFLQPKFDETVEISCNLNIDPKQSEKLVRGATILPHGIGKSVKVCAFCKGEDINKAKEAGADFSGSSDLIDKVKGGWLQFDKACATAEMMRDVAQLGKVLGPRGLMPSPKSGTVGPDITSIIKELKAGKVQFKTDKTANVHAVVGKVSFGAEQICENASTLIKAILAARPASVKGRFIKNMTISTTMGPGIKLDMGRMK